MALSPDLIEEILTVTNTSAMADRVRYTSVGGGDINDAYRLELEDKRCFVKINDADKYPQMFETEARGLELMRNCSRFQIPEVLGVGQSDGRQFLVLEYLESGSASIEFWELFANRLAGMHRSGHDVFGLDHSNYIGSLVQVNDIHESWPDFFTNQRLGPLSHKAFDMGLLSSSALKHFENLAHRLDQLIPIESPSLLHGDLWSGNFMRGPDGEATIYDPAVYFGHREMDIAMSKLFGGFDNRFYATYNEQYPLEKGWEDRVDIHNLYPLLVHVILFGGGYVSQVQSILNRFST